MQLENVLRQDRESIKKNLIYLQKMQVQKSYCASREYLIREIKYHLNSDECSE